MFVNVTWGDLMLSITTSFCDCAKFTFRSLKVGNVGEWMCPADWIWIIVHSSGNPGLIVKKSKGQSKHYFSIQPLRALNIHQKCCCNLAELCQRNLNLDWYIGQPEWATNDLKSASLLATQKSNKVHFITIKTTLMYHFSYISAQLLKF